MAYFNHAFTKIFLGTGVTRAAGPNTPANPHSTDGFITTAGTPTSVVALLGPGYFGMFDPNTYLAKDILTADNCCPLLLASSSLYSKDKISPFIGGYQETNKSKVINPKYIHRFYRVDTCVPQQSVASVGFTPQTAIPLLPVENFQGGTVQANCCYDFLCGETYYLRIDVKGSPALRFLNHNAYQTLSAYTGCCSGPVPTTVDPTTVYISWAKALVINDYIKSFVAPVVYDYTQVAWYAPGTTVSYDGLNTPVTPAQWWDNYPASAQALAWTPALANTCQAGMRLFGAYIETKFGNCSFQITDFFEKEIVKIYASLVDYTGDPCVFEGLCVYNDCLGKQGMGFGEQVLRDLIMSESYLQNFFATDIRIREITQGDQILNAINRNALYVRYFLLHSVPRFNNPTGTFDDDRYMLEVIVNTPNAAFEAFMNTWLTNCANCVTMETQACVHCTIIPD
jgi:hypothetical protein